MKLNDLGNEFDDMKRAVLGKLNRELLQGLVVDPMADPTSRWAPGHFKKYAKNLHVDWPDQMAKHGIPWGTAGKRKQYFAELDCYSGRDFFLDPNAGVATGKPDRRHIKPVEVLGLLRDHNVVAVYQHGEFGKTIEQRVQTVVQAL